MTRLLRLLILGELYKGFLEGGGMVGLACSVCIIHVLILLFHPNFNSFAKVVKSPQSLKTQCGTPVRILRWECVMIHSLVS